MTRECYLYYLGYFLEEFSSEEFSFKVSRQSIFHPLHIAQIENQFRSIYSPMTSVSAYQADLPLTNLLCYGVPKFCCKCSLNMQPTLLHYNVG